MYLLVRTDAQKQTLHSPVFDMESFFWALLFAILHPIRDELPEVERTIYSGLVPEVCGGDYSNDVRAKQAVLLALVLRFTDEALPHLRPYKVLIQDLAKLVHDYYALAEKRSARSETPLYTLEEEEEAISRYMDAFERFLSNSN